MFKRLNTKEEVAAVVKLFSTAYPYCVLDFETSDIDPHKAVLIDIQMGVGEDVFIFSGDFLQELKQLKCVQVWQNFKYDWTVAYRHGLDFSKEGAEVLDTMLLHHILDENAEHGLDSVVQTLWKDTYKEDFWAKYKSYEEAPEEARVEYACKDVVYTGKWFQQLILEIAKQETPDGLIKHVHALAMALWETEVRGIAVDKEYLIHMGDELKTRIKMLEPLMRKAGGVHCQILEMEQWLKVTEKAYTPKGKKYKTLPKPEFNFSSTSQLVALFYNELKLPVQKNHKTKSPSVDDAALTELKGKHPVVEMVQEYRGLQKTYTAFIEGTYERMQNGRIYPSFNVNGTVTGRISSNNPNLQQLPREGGVRGIYVPEKGYRFIACDYSQLEVCVAAHYSDDANLRRIIFDGASQHDITAEALGLERQKAKTLNFAMQYLCSPFKVADLLDCGRNEAQQIWKDYWTTYSGLKAFIDKCILELECGRPIKNPFGRVRRFPGYTRPEWADPAEGKFTKEERQCFNAIIQGTGGDITHRAYYRVNKELKRLGLGYTVLEVHDEIVIAAKETHCAEAAKVLELEMKGVGSEIGLRIPLSVSVSEPKERWDK